MTINLIMVAEVVLAGGRPPDVSKIFTETSIILI
jgi:hypothetical protein